MYGQINSFADLQHPPQCGGRPWHLQRPFLKKSGFNKSQDFSQVQNEVSITCVKTKRSQKVLNVSHPAVVDIPSVNIQGPFWQSMTVHM
jgi:hypothetical protein